MSLLSQATHESKVHVAIISEPSRNPNNNIRATDPTAVFVGMRGPSQAGMYEAAHNWAKIDSIYVYSCCAPPSLTLAEHKLDRLVLVVKGWSSKVIDGDFNAWATKWGNSLTNARGHCLLGAFDGQVYTYWKGGPVR